jgi:hypothetical protein
LGVGDGGAVECTLQAGDQGLNGIRTVLKGLGSNLIESGSGEGLIQSMSFGLVHFSIVEFVHAVISNRASVEGSVSQPFYRAPARRG